MKKLMIAVALIAAATCLNAATVMWNASGITQSSSGGSDLTKYTAYLIDNADFAYASLSADTLSTAIAAAVSEHAVASTGSVVYSNASVPSWADSTDHDAYVVVVDDVMGAYAVTAKKTVSIAGTGKGNALMGAVGAWQAVPEPTSGLLLLLGVAGLALRRRRA